MDAPIVIIDTMPNTVEGTELKINHLSSDDFCDMIENADEVLIGIHNKPDFNEKLKAIVNGYDFDSCDGYHRNVESYCEWVWVNDAVIYYITIA